MIIRKVTKITGYFCGFLCGIFLINQQKLSGKTRKRPDEVEIYWLPVSRVVTKFRSDNPLKAPGGQACCYLSSERLAYSKGNTEIVFAHGAINTDIYFV